MNGRTNIEIKSRAFSINPNIGPTESEPGDTVLSVKRIVAFSPFYRALASAGMELTLPTGSDRRGLGSEGFVFEPNLRAGVDWKQFVVQAAGALAVPDGSSNSNSQAKLDVAIGRYVFPDTRLQITPMIELNTITRLSGPSYGETKSAILPLGACPTLTVLLRRTIHDHLRRSRPEKSSTYSSSEYASGFSKPAASHLAAPPSPRYEGNVGQAPSPSEMAGLGAGRRRPGTDHRCARLCSSPPV